MGILETLGWTKRKARPVGQQLESGRAENQPPSKRRNLLVKAGIFLGLLLFTLFAFPLGEVYEYTVQEGDVWRQTALVAPFDFPVYKDPARLAEEKREVRETTPPYFRDVPGAQQRLAARRDSVEAQLERIFEAYASAQRNRRADRPILAAEDSLRYLRLRRNDTRLTLSAQQWRQLTRDYAEHSPALQDSAAGTATGPRLDEEALELAYNLNSELLSVGVLDVPRDSVHTDEIVIRNEEERVDRAKAKDNVYGLDEAFAYARASFNEQYPDRPDKAALTYGFFRSIFVTSLRYMRAETEEEWRRKAERIAPTREVVQRGEIVVQKGERVSPEVKRKLTSLERLQNERSGTTILWKQIAGEFLLALSTYLVFFLYLFFLRRDAFLDNRTVLLIALLFAGIIGLFAIVVRLPAVGLYVVPVAIASVHLTIMFDSRVGLFGTLTLAIIGGLLLGFDLEYTVATLFAGTLGVFSVRDIKNRGQYFISGGLVFVGYLVVLTGAWLYSGTSTDRLWTDLGFVLANSLFVIMAYPLLWVFERAFDITTDLTLLELSDTNRKLLKELSLRAPGSFNHSLQVANLAEAAADAVGANTLLTRVGALYHDIGKMLKPEYFVENQRTGDNPHDRLKPRMSALIIASHVKEGLEMGRQHNLPQRVLDFIPTHHGTTRIEYFYRKAMEQHEPDDSPVLESEFRYPGPRPMSRETGILMLADATEAASRSLEDPTHKRLETLIDAIFRSRSEDGQLDDTNLTFRDLREIRETFLSMLMGVYHVRVKYPDQQDEERRQGRERSKQKRSKQKAREEETSSQAQIANEEEEGTLGVPEQSVSTKRVREASDGPMTFSSDSSNENEVEESMDASGENAASENTDKDIGNTSLQNGASDAQTGNAQTGAGDGAAQQDPPQRNVPERGTSEGE